MLISDFPIIVLVTYRQENKSYCICLTKDVVPNFHFPFPSIPPEYSRTRLIFWFVANLKTITLIRAKIALPNTIPRTVILNLHSPAFPRLSDAMYRMLCSPAGNLSPGRFPKCIMSGTTPELSVAVGGVQVTDADVLPRSAVAIIFWGQFEKIGPKMSVQSNKRFVYLFFKRKDS